MAKKQDGFGCVDCGATFPRWSGRCAACGAMNTVRELRGSEVAVASGAAGPAHAAGPLVIEGLEAESPTLPRRGTRLGELDRVLGGGLVPGAAVLLTGQPGIGKSTLLAQVAGAVAGSTGPVLYVSAEESTAQVRARCHRLGVNAPALKLCASAAAEAIVGQIASGAHALVIVDSIQLTALSEVGGVPGSVAQVRACAAAMVEAAKRAGTALIIVGHVTKDGSLAGPRLLEHLVDTVLQFEGDRYQDLRSLRAVKNRFGSTNEIGLFEMTGSGLAEVADPAGVFIAGRDESVPGSCVAPALEGNRCLMVEIQALVNPTDFPQPQRRVAGCDTNRVAMILAVLSRRLGLPLGSCDVFVNVTSGARITEPAADLPIALAIASAWREQAVPADLVALGEIGLGGELRPAARYELRAAEARRLGFKRLLGPGTGSGRGRIVAGSLAEAIATALD
ncbi:MAG: DNA repair protein RadA [Planctomycetota bacterium]